MSTETTTTPQEEKARLWAQLDGADAGTTPAAATTEVTQGTAAAETTTKTAQADEAAAHKDAATTAASTEKAAVDDPYAGLPQIIRDEIAGLKSMTGQLATRLRNAEGHIGGLNTQLKQARETAQQAGKEAPTAAQVREAQGDPEKLKRLVTDYPEFGEAVKDALTEQAAALRAELAQTQKRPQGEQQVVTADDIARLRSEMAVETRHPGWQDRVKQPEFLGWLPSQPREVQLLASSDDPRDAIRLLDLHATARNEGTQRQQRQASAAAIPNTGRASSAARAKPIEQMSKTEYWDYLDQLDKQKG